VFRDGRKDRWPSPKPPGRPHRPILMASASSSRPPSGSIAAEPRPHCPQHGETHATAEPDQLEAEGLEEVTDAQLVRALRDGGHGGEFKDSATLQDA
jgi:hypothetical protein